MQSSLEEKGPLLPKTAVDAAEPVPPPTKENKDHPHFMGLPPQAMAGLAYCCASAGMVLLNKAALSSFDFTSPVSLLFFQCFVCVVLVKVTQAAGFIKLEPFSWDIARLWFPVNIIFVGMTWSSFAALKNLGVPMATVLKNLTNLFVIAGDMTFYGKRYGLYVWITLALMTVSALCGAFTDLEFNPVGYTWQLINCAFTAGYSLYLRGAMDRVVTLTQNNGKLDEFSMVFYNNLLSLPLIFSLMVMYGELATLPVEPAWQNNYFVMAFIASGLLAFFISFASLWFLSTTTATVYSLTGSLNKIPVAIVGFVAFNAPREAKNIASVLVGLLAGAIFVKAKQSGR
ncbi:hypothetical protein WJX84_002242 [Apatococcus fuscideae]|uniref:Sugar phosphate transporter domain-containing protein n=1 Tax=Apatococcus fuscideae TaxID=2026836 RepID=A0AAW1TF48_9CHLO